MRPAFAQAEQGTARERVRFALVRARVALHAAIQGLQPADGERRPEPGKWSVREHVLHLCAWDQDATRELQTAARGVPPTWNELSHAETDRLNAAGIERLRGLSWEDALRVLLTARAELMEQVEALPEEPAAIWSAEHPLGAMLLDLAGNDRHHAEAIRRLRAAPDVERPREDPS